MSAPNTAAKPPTLGVVLCGGLARRMGGADKAGMRIGGVTLLDRVLTRLRPQCDQLILNANNAARFAHTGLPIVADSVPDFAGPLAGILAGLDWAADHAPKIEWIVSAPTDCPFLPRDLVARLHRTRRESSALLACAASGSQRHPVVALWPVSLREELRHALAGEGVRKVEEWTARYRIGITEWPAEPIDPFFNVNTPEDAAEAERIAARYPDL